MSRIGKFIQIQRAYRVKEGVVKREGASQLAAGWAPDASLRRGTGVRYVHSAKGTMASLQDEYDDAMYAFSTGDTDRAIAALKEILAKEPNHFDAQLSLGM